MADDIYAALLGNPQNDDAAKLAALARSLRGQSNMGLIAQVSGDSVLSPIGKQMMDTSNKQAEDYGSRAEQARYRGYQEQTSARAAEQNAREQAWREKNAKDQMAHDLALEHLRQSGDVQVERLRQGGKVGDESKQALKDKKVLDAYTVKYGKELEAAGLPQMRVAVGNVNKELEKYGEGNLPGINPGGGFTSLFSKGGRQLRTALQPVKNIMMRLRSGAAVTPSEADRLEAEMFGIGATDESFRQAWAQIQQLVDAQEMNINKSYDPAVLENYSSHSGRGGFGAGSGTAGMEYTDAIRKAAGTGGYSVGDVISKGGKKFRVTAVDPMDPTDPEVEEVQ